MPFENSWRVIATRTVVAALVMGLIAVLMLLLLATLPQYRDLWLILLGVLETGAIGIWRAEIDAHARKVEWRREVNFKRLDDTQTYITQTVAYLYDRSTAVTTGESPPRLPDVPLYAELDLAGDVDALIGWHGVTGTLMRTTSPLTIPQGLDLVEAASKISAALQAQRMRLWRRQRPSLLSPEDAKRVQAAARATRP